MSSDTSFVSDLGDWFVAQSLACQGLGSPFYGELLSTIARRIPSEIAQVTGTDWRFGDMLPLRLMGAAHFAAQNGTAPALATHFPSTGGNGRSDQRGRAGGRDRIGVCSTFDAIR